MAEPFVSVRKHIKWGDKPAGENTSTLVLTSADKHYVDIRILNPDQPFPNDPSDSKALSRLEWGFAGTAISTHAEYKDGELVKPAHTQWIHEVDNKIRHPGSDDRDEGFMYPIAGTSQVLEKGAMMNPDSGEVENYEELWEDLDIQKVGNEKSHVSWVLRSGSNEEEKGMVIRIGEWIQGVLRRGEEFSVGQWKWDSGKGWQRVLMIGNGLDLGEKLFGEQDILVGDTFMADNGLEWECKSVHIWT